MREIITMIVCIVIFLIALQSGIIRTGLEFETVQKANENLQSANAQLSEEIKRINHLAPGQETGSAAQLGRLELMEKAKADLQKQLAREIKTREIVLQEANDSLKLVILDKALFEAQSEKIKPEVQSKLQKIAKILADYTGLEIHIAGYTDNQKLTGAAAKKYLDLRHFSSARALAVLGFLQSEGGIDPVQMAAMGFGDVRPVAPNDSEFHRALNGRIEISLHPMDEEQLAKTREIYRTEALLPNKTGNSKVKIQKEPGDESAPAEPIGEESLNQGDNSNFGAGYEVPESAK
jgi:chemotaxis protein MotB